MGTSVPPLRGIRRIALVREDLVVPRLDLSSILGLHDHFSVPTLELQGEVIVFCLETAGLEPTGLEFYH